MHALKTGIFTLYIENVPALVAGPPAPDLSVTPGAAVDALTFSGSHSHRWCSRYRTLLYIFYAKSLRKYTGRYMSDSVAGG